MTLTPKAWSERDLARNCCARSAPTRRTVVVVELATVHLWRVPRRAVPSALARMALDRRELARTPGCRFWKLVGTGDGRTFTLRDADLRTWGLVATWDDAAALSAFERTSTVARGWRRLADEAWRADLAPVRTRGRWAGREPFGVRPRPPGAPSEGAGDDERAGRAGGGRPWGDEPVAAITRARLAPRAARRFWAAVPPVAAEARTAPGLLLSVGMGEAPLGLQGTFSVWRSAADLVAFAYRLPEHRAAVDATPGEGWYAEELFARFAVLQTTGTVEGGRRVP